MVLDIWEVYSNCFPIVKLCNSSIDGAEVHTESGRMWAESRGQTAGGGWCRGSYQKVECGQRANDNVNNKGRRQKVGADSSRWWGDGSGQTSRGGTDGSGQTARARRQVPREDSSRQGARGEDDE